MEFVNSIEKRLFLSPPPPPPPPHTHIHKHARFTMICEVPMLILVLITKREFFLS